MDKKQNVESTVMYESVKKKDKMTKKEVIMHVYNALNEKGYNELNQLVGYFLSNDPTYITSHNDARKTILKYDSEDLLEEIVKFYLENNK